MNNEVVLTNSEYVMERPVERTEDNFIVQLTNTKSVSFCSMVAKTDADKVKLYNAINNAEERLAECVNMEIKAKDVFVEIVQCTNEETGEVKTCPRTVIIDDKGVGYTAVSVGVFSSLKKIFDVFGVPQEWEKPLTIVPKVITKGSKKITTLSIKA